MFGGNRFLLNHYRLMSQVRKRPLSSAENTPVQLKQSRLQFGPQAQLSLKTPQKDEQPSHEPPQPLEANDLLTCATAPLKGTIWMSKIQGELNKPYMKAVFKRLSDEAKAGQTVFPPTNLIFNAFRLTPFDDIRVVILGQDPYHGAGQAHGLSFSVPIGVPKPPSLKNIFKELVKEYPDFKVPDHGSLIKWAEQGVFMLNATLTVQEGRANSHRDIGWQNFTDSVIKMIDRDLTGVVFLLWGNFAQKKAAFVDKKKHAVVKTAHPSPLSYRLFEGCKCFTKVNYELRRMNRKEINWSNL